MELPQRQPLQSGRKSPCGAEGEESERCRRGLVASIDTNLKLLALVVFYHFSNQVNAFFSGNAPAATEPAKARIGQRRISPALVGTSLPWFVGLGFTQALL